MGRFNPNPRRSLSAASSNSPSGSNSKTEPLETGASVLGGTRFMTWRMTEEQFAARAQRIAAAYKVQPGIVLPLATARIKTRKMNKTEMAYAKDLAARKMAGEIIWFEYEAITFKLADDTRYTPDFAVQLASNAFELHETKGGFIRDDAWVKLKVAARLFPFKFLKCVQRPKKEGGGFIITEVPA